MKRFSMFLVSCVFIGLAAFAVPFDFMPNYEPFLSVKVQGYETTPLEVSDGETLHVEATFRVPRDMYAANVRCYCTFESFYREELLGENAGLVNGSFPITAGQEVTLSVEIPFYVELPAGLPVKLYICIDDVLYAPVVGGVLDVITR